MQRCGKKELGQIVVGYDLPLVGFLNVMAGGGLMRT
jgi:hypothetical protein